MVATGLTAAQLLDAILACAKALDDQPVPLPSYIFIPRRMYRYIRKTLKLHGFAKRRGIRGRKRSLYPK